MDPIYVTGHRNPDTDSVVGAMAYAALRNATTGARNYEAACLGHVSDETKIVLDYFGFQPPKLITTMHTQVKDLDYDTPPLLGAYVAVSRAWEILQKEEHIRSLPVAKDDGTLFGILSKDDVANYNMVQVTKGYLDPVPMFNVLSELEGKILNDAGENVDEIGGEISIALPQTDEHLLFNSADSIVLCGHQPDMMRRALEMNVNALILCQTELPPELKEMETNTCIIFTPFDAYRASRLLFQSTPVARMCRTENIIRLHLEDRVDKVKEQVLKFRDASFPILDENDKVVGVLTRYHLLRPRRKRVVLVDHNEAAQSVPGLEEAEILEIIDHHRLADIQTSNPIYVRNEPVGSTNTIIAGMFQEEGLMPSPAMAGMIAAAIISDTVMFKSPTCTERDHKMAERMARIANVSLEELGKTIFSSALDSKSAQDLLDTDYKEFHIAGHDLAVAQVTCVDSESVVSRKAEFLALMEKRAKERGFSVMILMITDVLQEGSHIIFVGKDDIIQQAFGVTPRENILFLPNVMSRKKQIIPMLSALWG